jgi:hypothetical protein
VRVCACRQASKAAQSSQYQLWEEDELRDLCSSVGLQGFVRTRSFRFIMFSATKPAAADEA